MKRFLVLLFSILLLFVFTLTGCESPSASSETGNMDSITDSDIQSEQHMTQSTGTDYSKFESLARLIFNCPNQELLEARLNDTQYIEIDSSGAGSGQEPQSNEEGGIEPYFAPYVSEDYLQVFLQGYGMQGHGIFDGEGVSYVDSIEIEAAEDSENRKFTLAIVCESNQGNSETLEIVGSFRQDEDGKVANINFRSGYGEYINFFKKPDQESESIS